MFRNVYKINYSGQPESSYRYTFNNAVGSVSHTGRNAHIIRDEDGVVCAAYSESTGKLVCNDQAPCGERTVCPLSTYDVGPDELGFSDDLSVYFVWIVYSYEVGDYCGSGYAVALDHAGRLHQFNLGHCSCYGPCEDIEEFSGGKGTDAVTALAGSDSIHNWFDCSDCEAKVRELLAGGRTA